ncbi:MAG: SusC/RagA family TonB-linked outer membrane protein [Gemmatimonadaceae bacterium]
MTRIARTRITVPFIALLLSLFGAQEARAQAAVINGRVTNEQGAPIPGANVAIPTLGIGASANANGDYSFTVPDAQANGQTVTLQARFIGFTPASRSITLSAGTQTANFSLRADPFRLEEVVVTGVSAATSRQKLTFSVASVSEDQIKEVPASSPIAALAGKVSGARVAIGRGNPGAQPTIRLRGSTGLRVGSSTPLILLDGVISRANIADIDANDIESIEVLKGAAASSFYGSNAANGVVSITTKRGRGVPDGSMSFILRSEYGKTELQKYVELNRSHHYLTNPDGDFALTPSGERILDPDGIADNPYLTTGPSRWRNHLKDWLGDGSVFYSNNFQMGARRGATNFHSSYTADRNGGILPLTSGQFRQNVRLNVDQGIGSRADVSFSATYGVNKNDYNPNGAQSWFTFMQMPPEIDLRKPYPDSVEFYPKVPSPSARDNPLYALANREYTLRRERIIGSASARYRPVDWLRLEASYGTDRLNARESTYDFRGYLSTVGVPSEGYIQRDTDNNVSENAALNATATGRFGGVVSTSRLGYSYEEFNQSFFTASGNKLNVTGVTDLGAVDPANNFVNSFDATSRTINYLGSQAFDIRDRYLLDFLFRSDGSSLFGPDNRRENFYRVSGAWRISEDFTIPGVQEFKIRAAQGTAGLRPSFLDQYEYYSLGSGTISKAQLGNVLLKPAIQTEKEFGINTTFGSRFDLELVQANRITRGAFLNIPLSVAQSGGFSQQVRNAADVEAKTTEFMLQTRVFDRPTFGYSFSLTGDKTSQKILKLGRAPFRVNPEGDQGQDAFYYKEGAPLGIIYGAKWVRSFAELADDPKRAINQNCGTVAAPVLCTESDYIVNALGYLVRNTPAGRNAAIPYINAAGETQHIIGDVNPDLSFGFANNIRWNAFSIYALFDGQRGGDVYNFTKQWMFQDHRHGDLDMAGKADADKVPLNFFAAGLYNGLVANDYFVEDGSYVKLRELSVAYRLGDRALQVAGLNRFASGIKLALIGRNLLTWSDYTGFDPDVTSGSDFNFRMDGFKYPNFRTFTGQVEITF